MTLLKKAPLGTTPKNMDNASLAGAITRGELLLSISPMLGCDYIFVRHKGMHELLQPRIANKTIHEILCLLDIAPRGSMVVGVDQLDNGAFAFTRYDYTWERRQVKNVSIIPVTQSEQIEFLEMMFHCSSDH